MKVPSIQGAENYFHPLMLAINTYGNIHIVCRIGIGIELTYDAYMNSRLILSYLYAQYSVHSVYWIQ